MVTFNRLLVFLPVVLILLSASLSIHYLVALPLWIDEGWTVAAAQQPTLADSLNFIQADVHPPLYFLLLKGWILLAGDSVLSMRLLAWWAVLLTVALTYRLGQLFGGYKTALAGSLMVITSDLVISLTPEVRHYTVYMLLVTLSSLCYIQFARTWSRRWGIGYTASAVLLLYTLYWGVFILAAHGVHALFYHREQWRRGVPIFLLIAVCYVPWLPSMASQLGGNELNTVDAGGYQNALKLDRTGLEITAFQLFGKPEAIFIGLALAGMVGAWRFGETEVPRDTLKSGLKPTPPDQMESRELTHFFALWLFVPLGLAFLSAALDYSLLTHRPLIALVPPMALLAGQTLSQFKPWSFYLLVAILTAMNLTTTGATPPPRAPWDEVGEFLQISSPADAVLLESDLNVYAMEHHLKLANIPAQMVIRSHQQRGGYANEPRESVRESVDQFKNLWLVEYLRGEDLRPLLGELGFIQTTPTLNLGYFLLDDIHLTRFARVEDLTPMVTYGENLALVGADFFQWEGQLKINLLWLPQTDLTQNYTVSVFLLAADGWVAAQQDSYPLNGQNPTAGWGANLPQFDRHQLHLAGVPAGSYHVGVKVYLWENGVITDLGVQPCAEQKCSWSVVGEMTFE